MTEANRDIYREGAAMSVGASTAIADLVGDKTRELFKQAFFNTLAAFVYESGEEGRAWLAETAALSKSAMTRWSFDEFKEAVERSAKARGLR